MLRLVDDLINLPQRTRWCAAGRFVGIERGDLWRVIFLVTIAGGRIVGVGTRANEGAEIDLGNVAILPGLVNAHTHLEFSLFDQPLVTPGQSFATWLTHVIAWRREQPAGAAVDSHTMDRPREPA